MALEFEWDGIKSRKNITKHDITFEEATTVFGDPLSITIIDDLHSSHEERLITIGVSSKGKLLVVSHTDRYNKIRMISARNATNHERNNYEKKNPR